MTDIYKNIGQTTISSAGFVPLAIEAGIEAVINSILSGLAMDRRSLVIAVKDALKDSNPELAAAINTDNLQAVIEFISLSTGTLYMTNELPKTVDVAGPASVTATRDGGVTTQVNITFSAPPTVEGSDPTAWWDARILLDGVPVKTLTNIDGTSGFVNTFIENVTAGGHTIRVLYVDPATGDQGLFGQLASVS